MAEAIQTLNLSRHFNSLVAVDRLNLTIHEGELFSLLGPNGAGKTTTINMLCCLLKPTSGTARVAGYDIVRDSYKIKELIGVCPQETALSERLNAWENLSLIGRLHNLSPKAIKQNSHELLQKLGLLERAGEGVGRYSGGMKRRLSLIAALVHDPQILFLDEPTLGLDPQARRVLWEYIQALKGKKTILLTTHYMEEADLLSDGVGIIDQGKIVALGSPRELKSQFNQAQALRLQVSSLSPQARAELQIRWEVSTEEEGQLKLKGKDLTLKEVVDRLHSQGVTVYSAAKEEPSLEDVFLAITGKELRE